MQITDAQKWLIFTVVIAVGYLVYLLAPILTPFLISAFLAYLADPAVDKLQTIKFSRTLSVIFVFFLMTIILGSFLLIVVPLIEEQLMRLIRQLPDMLNLIQTEWLPWLSNRLGMDLSNINFDEMKKSLTGHWQTLGNVVGKIFVQITASGQTVLLWVSYLLLIPVVTFYLLRDWDDLIARIGTLLPRKYSATVIHLAKQCDEVLAEFLRGQMLVMLALSTVYSTGLWIVGLEFSILIGLMAGLVSFVPYLGFIVGFAVAGVAAFMQFQDLVHIVYVLLVFGVGQTLEGMVLTPLLVGDRIGLHPVAVIFAVMAGAQLFGLFGMLLALPVAAVITVLLRHFHQEYMKSSFYTP